MRTSIKRRYSTLDLLEIAVGGLRWLSWGVAGFGLFHVLAGVIAIVGANPVDAVEYGITVMGFSVMGVAVFYALDALVEIQQDRAFFEACRVREREAKRWAMSDLERAETAIYDHEKDGL